MIFGLALWLGCALGVFKHSAQAQAQAQALSKPSGLKHTVAKLQPFSTDGCSLFPDGPFWQEDLWRNCCVAHDMAYWKGGNYWERLAADEALMVCVDKVGEPLIGAAMLLGVRVGGSPFWPTTFKWGYGWQPWRGYQTLTKKELNAVEAMLIKQGLLRPKAANLVRIN